MAMTLVSKTQSRIPEADFPRESSLREQLNFILQYANQAPSFFETQPWQFEINEDTLEVSLFADSSRWIQAADPNKRQLFASIGCALENLLVALDAFELGHRLIVYFPEPGDERWVARVTVATSRQSIVPRPRELLAAIPTSSAVPYGFRTQAPSATDLAACIAFMDDFVYEDTAMKHRTGVHTFSDADARRQLLELVSESNTTWYGNANIRQDLYKALGTEQGRSVLLMDDLDCVESDPDFGKQLGERHLSMLAGVPMFGIITSNFDDPTAFVQAGQTLGRIGLEGQLRGLGIYPLPQLVELPESRTRLEQLLPDAAGFAQLPFILGYIDHPKSARNPGDSGITKR